MDELKLNWLKPKGYLHITPQLDISRNQASIIRKVTSKEFVAKYAFFPLIHSIIKERKFKKTNGNKKRAHSYRDSNGVTKSNAKNRPLHYATHFDAIIFGFYAELLQNEYEKLLSQDIILNQSIIAYRKIPIEGSIKNKSTIHFAHEIFSEIKHRGNNKECAVLAFDIKSFFSSLDHKLLKEKWANLLNLKTLPADHYNVFKACTRFSYILKDDLRVKTIKGKGRAGFDEKELARIRNNFGINSFFESAKDFRDKLKDGKFKLYRYPFRNEEKTPIGIPQGLPISAILANLYLLDFDKQIINYVVKELGGFYRRYSDDIAIVCEVNQIDAINNFVSNEIEKSLVKISSEKTEVFHFRYVRFGNKDPRLTSTKFKDGASVIIAPFIYLGFEFNGTQALIKSANLAKFYRRMISSIKRKAKRSLLIADMEPSKKPVVYRRQLYKLYSLLNLNKTKIHTNRKKIVNADYGKFKVISFKRTKYLRSNYFSYGIRASVIMNEPQIARQTRNHARIFNEAIFKHLKRKER